VNAREVVAAHEAAGRYFEAAGVRSFVRGEGEGPPVLLMHGVPASSFLYRKMLPGIAAAGFRAVAFDLPGLGLASRPEGFDYSWTGLGAWARAAVDVLELDAFHLVVHDIGGPVGFELAVTEGARVRSLTLLNTLIDVVAFRRIWSMDAFALPAVGAVWLRATTPSVFRALMYMQGIADRGATPKAELDAWVHLLKREDGGRAFRKIMQGFETTPEKRDLYTRVVRELECPKRVIWGSADRALPLHREGRIARELTGVDEILEVPAKHFLQEDQAPAIVEHLVPFLRSAELGSPT